MGKPYLIDDQNVFNNDNNDESVNFHQLKASISNSMFHILTNS